MKEKEKAYVRIYTGNGQGKTSAAFGILVRALCAGKVAYVGQFIKDELYNETNITHFCKHVVIEQLGTGCFLERKPNLLDKEAAQAALAHCAELMASGIYDLVILDELTIAIFYKLLTVEEVVEALKKRCETTEVVITGRYAPQALIDMADLVSDLHEVKHYYQQGVLSRDGFDH